MGKLILQQRHLADYSTLTIDRVGDLLVGIETEEGKVPSFGEFMSQLVPLPLYIHQAYLSLIHTIIQRYPAAKLNIMFYVINSFRSWLARRQPTKKEALQYARSLVTMSLVGTKSSSGAAVSTSPIDDGLCDYQQSIDQLRLYYQQLIAHDSQGYVIALHQPVALHHQRTIITSPCLRQWCVHDLWEGEDN
jgi:hypothetical protein